MSAQFSTQSILYLVAKLFDLVLMAVKAYKTWKKEREVEKIKSDAVSSFLNTFNPPSKGKRHEDNSVL